MDTNQSRRIRAYFDAGEGMPGKGPIPAKWCIVGISPSTKRPAHRQLEPFGAASYALIERIRGQVPSLYVTNAVKVPHAPGSPPTAADLHHWAPLLYDELSLVRPKRILALGDLPARALCPSSFKTMREDHGTFFHNEQLNAWVVPTYHFAAAARNPGLGRQLSRDLSRFFDLPDPEPSPYQLVDDAYLRDLPDLIPEGAEVILDLETTGLELDARIISLGLYWEGAQIPHILLEPTEAQLLKLGRIFKARQVQLTGHNMNFDLRILIANTGWKWPYLPTGDTMILAHLGGEEILSLKHLTTLHTDLPGSRMGGGPEDPLYLAEDIRSTQALTEVFQNQSETFIYSVLKDLVPLVSQIQLRGVYIDGDRLWEVEEWATKRVAEKLEILTGISGEPDINWGSTAQVAAVLKRLRVPLIFRTKSGAPSVAEKALLPLRDKYPVVAALLDYREAQKALSGFVYSYDQLMDQDGYLHPRLKLTGTRTGRLSMVEPNLQQVTRTGPLKKSFVPRWDEGYYGLVDLDQAELRIAALLSQDDELLRALLSEDVHREIASMVFKLPPEQIDSTQRKASKKVTFGLLYGGTAKGIGEKAGISTEETQEILKSFLGRMKKLDRWMRTQKRDAEANGYIETLFGRRRDISMYLDLGQLPRVHRLAVNTPIQSLASDCMLIITRGLHRRLREGRFRSRILFGVHDSLLVEVYPGEGERVAHAVQKSFEDLWLSPLSAIEMFHLLPLTGSFVLGRSWAAVESTNENYAPEGSWLCSSATGDPQAALIIREEKEDWEEDDEDE